MEKSRVYKKCLNVTILHWRNGKSRDLRRSTCKLYKLFVSSLLEKAYHYSSRHRWIFYNVRFTYYYVFPMSWTTLEALAVSGKKDTSRVMSLDPNFCNQNENVIRINHDTFYGTHRNTLEGMSQHKLSKLSITGKTLLCLWWILFVLSGLFSERKRNEWVVERAVIYIVINSNSKITFRIHFNVFRMISPNPIVCFVTVIIFE